MAWFEDVRYGARSLAKNYVFTFVAVVTLALGIGANAAVFTLSNAMLFKGFPFDQNDRILYMLNRNTTRTDQFAGLSYPEFRDWRKATSLDGMAAVNGMRVSLSDQSGLPESFTGTQISANGFKLIGQKPAIGRDFTSADEAAGAPPVAILTYGLWERRYGKDPIADRPDDSNQWRSDHGYRRHAARIRAAGALFLVFAVIALLLASIGLNALIAHSVNQRAQEIGVRMAIGATASDILRLVFAQGLRPMAIGLGIGLAGAFAVTRILKSALVQVSAADPTTFVTASVVLALAATLGCLTPARRAMRVDPVIALHHE